VFIGSLEEGCHSQKEFGDGKKKNPTAADYHSDYLPAIQCNLQQGVSPWRNEKLLHGRVSRRIEFGI